MAGVGPPPGPYLGFQSSVQPIGFERFQLDNPAADDNRPAGSPLPPSQDTYQPTCNLNANYDIAVSLPATSTTHPYHQYEGEISENGLKLPYVGFEWIAKEDEDTKYWTNMHSVRTITELRGRPNPYITDEIRELMKVRDYWQKLARRRSEIPGNALQENKNLKREVNGEKLG